MPGESCAMCRYLVGHAESCPRWAPDPKVAGWNEAVEAAIKAIASGTCQQCHQPITWDERGGEARTGAWEHVGDGGLHNASPNGYPAGADILRRLKK